MTGSPQQEYLSILEENSFTILYHIIKGENRTMSETTTAILVVSFGTSFEDTRKLTIDAIEQDIRDAFPKCHIYRAWTSKMIMAKLLKRDHVKINNVKEAMKQMHEDGITDVIVQPTHVMNGVENDLMKEDALSCRGLFSSVTFGTPLLTSEEDSTVMIQAIHGEFSDLKPQEALVLMGHGTTHYANSIYAALDYKFKDLGYSNIFVGTVEAYPSFDTLLRQLSAFHPAKVILAPFMIVAGDHARNDMAGEDEDSWCSQLVRAGYEVSCTVKGLGEYPVVRKLLISHINAAMKEADVQSVD